MLGFSQSKSFGLIPLSGLTGALEIVAAFLLLDLSFYYWHLANHRIAFLWRFHNVHHIDPDLDVSTAFRFHFVEVGFSAGFRAIQVLLIGPSLAAYVIYEVAFQLGTLFHHSNLREEDLSNFGVVFTWWDRLHRTLRLNVPQAEVTIGIPGYSRPEDNGLLRSFLMPFRAQRDYWSGPQGRRLRRERRA